MCDIKLNLNRDYQRGISVSDTLLTLTVIGLVIGLIGAPMGITAAWIMSKRGQAMGVIVWASIASLAGIAIGTNVILIATKYNWWGL